MGLASKIAASGPRPSAPGAAPVQNQQGQQGVYGQQQSSYGQPSGNPPYPVQLGAPAPAMSTRPGGHNVYSNTPSPYTGQSSSGSQQSQYGRPAYVPQTSRPSDVGQQFPERYDSHGYGSQVNQRPTTYGEPQNQYGNPRNQYGESFQNSGTTQVSIPQQFDQYRPMQLPQAMSQTPSPSMQPPGVVTGQAGVVRDNILRIVRENHLEIFYPQHKLSEVIAQAQAIDYRSLATEWDIPLEIATDLAALALYDIVLYCDDSGSMRAEERGERIDDLKLILSRVSEVMTKFDADGIQIRFMNSDIHGNGVRTAAEASQLVQQVRFSGITPLGTNLDKKIIQPLVMQAIRSRSLHKPVLIIVITDGEPVGEPRDLTRKVILESTRVTAQQGYPGALRFQFAQVGKDMKAQAFLSELDNDAQIGGFIDATSYFELEAMEMERKGITLTPDLWLVKLCVGSIDSTYDAQDE